MKERKTKHNYSTFFELSVNFGAEWWRMGQKIFEKMPKPKIIFAENLNLKTNEQNRNVTQWSDQFQTLFRVTNVTTPLAKPFDGIWRSKCPYLSAVAN